MGTRVLKVIGKFFAAASVAVLLPAVMLGQSASSRAGGSNNIPSRWDIFAGYSYLAPKGTVATTDTSGNPLSGSYKAVNGGAIASGAYFFNRYGGLQVEVGLNEKGTNDGFTTLAAGMIFRFPMENITPFVHGLVGLARTSGPNLEPGKWGPGLTAGGGMDYETPWFNHHLAIRLFQADYEYMHADWGPVAYGGRANVNAARLSAGIVIHAGSIAPPPPVTLACAASPDSVYPGDPVTVTATAGNLDPKANVIYSWSGTGVTGSGTTATVATGSLAPGSYTVKCGVKEGKPGREGLKPWETADATASLTVKAFQPPTIGCSANPTSINPGDKSVITATGVSPQNRPLTYTYTASSGTVNGSGSTATFDSTGAAPGNVNVNCNVADDVGNTATASAMLTIVAPPPPPPPAPSPEQVRLEARLALHSVFFPTALPRAEHPDGGLVASQQATLTTLAADFKSYLAIKPDAHLTLTGHADVRGTVDYNQALTERRVNRAKQFLVEQGVPESSIDTRAVGKEQQLSADQVKDLVDQNTELTDAERARVLHQLNVIVLAQNRRVDITLSTTGQQSVQLYPFNAKDAVTLLGTQSPTPRSKAAAKKTR